MAVSAPNRARFGDFELDLKAGEVRKGTGRILLQEQPFQILLMLVEHRGEVVSRDEIKKRLWPNDTVVEFDHSIHTAIKKLRQALGDAAESPKYVETVARRGYRLLVPVEWVEASPADQQPVVSPDQSPCVESAAPYLIGKRVSHYRVLELLGGGGMGVVYKAEDLKLGRRVALKFLPEELAHDAAAMGRFEREARAASALNHPNICTIYGVDEHAALAFIVMELLEGQTLRELISPMEAPPRGTDAKKSLLPTRRLLDVAIQIAEGLDAAHKKGIIHRDIKPANIFVTINEQVKILDFGVAKLQESEDQQPMALGAQPSKQEGSSHLTLTRTGSAIGTAGYMSPEQIKGEKLDARTDLFSFGLVLYEMATGQRAFAGDTAQILHEAIVRQKSTPARELNPELPMKLEKIIGKALEKDREARYQSAAEVLADLRNLRQERESRFGRRGRALAAGVVAALVIVGTILWFARFRPVARQSPPELKVSQLTTNSFENRVKSGTISPDGKYLAYSDTKGMYVKLIDTGETRAVSQPEELKDRNEGWECVSWLPDSAGFVANSHRAGLDPTLWDSHESEIWMVPLLGGAPRKLRDNAMAYSVSPDGSVIGFGTNKGKLGDREIWLMGSSGDQARKLFDTDEESSISGLSWSRNGERVLYVKTDQSGDTLLSRDLRSGPPTTILGTSEMKQVNGFLWLADGRFIYEVAEPVSSGSACNFWEMRLDGRTGEPSEKPRRLTNWSGLCNMVGPSETADGKKLVFRRWVTRTTSFLADLADGGNRILNPKHFPLSESSEGIAGWTLDSKEGFLVSNRSGHYGIYRQPLDQDIAQPVVTEGYGRNPCVTPDGKSILYLGIGENGPWPARGPEPVMRVSINGGPSQQLFTARRDSIMTCARSRSQLCVIGEPTEDGTQLAVSVLDPMKGRGPELFRFALGNDGYQTLQLSPDGTRVAVIRSTAGPIYIFSLQGQELERIHVKGWSSLESLFWAADGKSLFVTAGMTNGKEILHVDLQGNAYALWESTGGNGETEAHPSPDGRRLAFSGGTTSGNMWMIENY